MKTKTQSVTITGLADVAQMRTATFEDREHLVVPVVALVGDAVVRPMNSRGPEFVPREELAFAPAGWNGRPVVPNHPNGGKSSANSPAMIEGMCFGRVFNTRIEDGDLKMDAWLDVERARTMGGEAEEVVNRVLAGEMVEVSVGAWVAAEEEKGTSPSGEPYDFIWRGIIPDHLAFLPKGMQGACSIKRGCGAPRAAQEIINTKIVEGDKLMKTNSLFTRARDFFTRLAAGYDDGQSDNALRAKVESALRAEEPGFMGVSEMYSEAGACIYSVCPSTEWLTIHRTFTVADDGEVTLNDDRTPVSAQTRWVPMAEDGSEPGQLAGLAAELESLVGKRHSGGDEKMIQTIHDHAASLGASCDAASQKSMRAACACGGEKSPAPSEPATAGEPATIPAKGGSVNENTKALVGKILASKDTPFDEGDRAKLESCSEEKLTALAARLEPAKEPELKELSEEQFMKLAPPSVRKTLRAAQEQAKAKHDGLVKALSEAQEEWPADVLAKKTTEDLEGLARILGLADKDSAVDFSPLAARAEGGEPAAYIGPYSSALKSNAKN